MKSGGKNGGRPKLAFDAGLHAARIQDELEGLREYHARGVRDGEPSRMVRKGWQSIVDGHILTDAELAFVGVAQPNPKPDTEPTGREHRPGETITLAPYEPRMLVRDGGQFEPMKMEPRYEPLEEL